MKKIMKGALAWFSIIMLALCMFTSITGCEKKADTKENSSSSESENSGATKTEKKEMDLLSMTSVELAREMGNGFNLGNTMEAYGHKEGIDKETSFYETLWGNPVTTQELFDHYKECGFNSVRIPVAWTNKMDFENDDFTISEDYLARVKEIVDYAYNCDMYVIINDHWDGGWWGMYGAKDKKIVKRAEELYDSMWHQIAEYFKDYDYHLIFEGGNEEIGDRLNDIDEDFNPNGATLGMEQCYKKSTEINQKFVDIVRSTGGNNEDRFLLIPGYNTDITRTIYKSFKMPVDTAKDKLLLSVHYYTPWEYCGGTGEVQWGTKDNFKEMNDLMKTLAEHKFKNSEGEVKDYGVIIGECAVGPTESGSMKTNAIMWYKNLFANCDYYGYVPMLWDTGNQMDRETGEWIDDSLPEFFKSKARSTEEGLSLDEIKENALKTMETLLGESPDTYQEEGALKDDGKTAIAWIMWNSGDWNIAYSVGDVYKPDDTTEGLKATDVEITGEGTYTVSLDFTGTSMGYSDSTAFSAVGIANGEELFPGYIMDITSVKINGEDFKLDGNPYTTSDDKLCTRVNLYNSWVTGIPDGIRTKDGLKKKDVTAIPMRAEKLSEIETIEVTFDYIKG